MQEPYSSITLSVRSLPAWAAQPPGALSFKPQQPRQLWKLSALLCQWHSEQQFLFWMLPKPSQQVSMQVMAGLLHSKQLFMKTIKEPLLLLSLLLEEMRQGPSFAR